MSLNLKSNVGGTFNSDHIYYNITILNSDDGNQKPPAVIFNEIRNSPYLDNPQDYYMSVVRFSLETPTLPLFVPQAKLGQNDPNLLVYTITLSWQDSSAGVLGTNFVQQTNVTWSPQVSNEPIPSPPIDFQDLTSAYYHCFSYQWFIDRVNIALSSCYTALKAQVVAAGKTLPSNFAPIMEWAVPDYQAIIDADISGYNLNNDISGALVRPIKLFFNAPMYNLFSSFEAFGLGYEAVTSGRNFQIRLRNNNGLNIYSPMPAGWTAIQAYQEYATTPLWNPVQSLVFTTALLPVVPELTSVPRLFGSDAKFYNVGNNSNITSILTDFEVGLTTGVEYKPNVQYVPSSEYRLADLFGNNPLSAIEVRVFWKDPWGNLNPFLLNSGCSASIKILFRKKTFQTVGY